MTKKELLSKVTAGVVFKAIEAEGHVTNRRVWLGRAVLEAAGADRDMIPVGQYDAVLASVQRRAVKLAAELAETNPHIEETSMGFRRTGFRFVPAEEVAEREAASLERARALDTAEEARQALRALGLPEGEKGRDASDTTFTADELLTIVRKLQGAK